MLYKKTALDASGLIQRWVLVPILIGGAIGLAEVALVEAYSVMHVELYPFLSSPLAFLVLPSGLLISYTISTLIGHTRPGSTTHEVLQKFHFRDGEGTLRSDISTPIASAVTMGFGGSAGLEGPSLSLGGAISYRLSRMLGAKGDDLRVLFLAGAGSALGAVLKAPLTGILFAIEVPYTQDLEHRVFLPAIPMGTVSYLVYILFEGKTPIFSLLSSSPFPTYIELMLSLLLGAFLGGIALAFIYVYKLGSKLSLGPSFALRGAFISIMAGLLIAAIGYVEPYSLGVGYRVISSSMNASLPDSLWSFGAGSILLLVFAKMMTTSATLNGGGDGGLFIPSILLGATASVGLMRVLGLPFSPILVAAGAAAMVAATNKTPLASVAFVAETMTPSAIIPALLATAVAYTVTSNKGLYEGQLDFSPARTHLALLRLGALARKGKNNVIELKDIVKPVRFKLLLTDNTKKALSLLSISGDTSLPVVDHSGKYIGRLDLENLAANPSWSIERLMIADKPLLITDWGETATELILRRAKGMIYVTDEEGKLRGVIRTADLVKAYAKLLEAEDSSGSTGIPDAT